MKVNFLPSGIAAVGILIITPPLDPLTILDPAGVPLNEYFKLSIFVAVIPISDET